ncbi:MAG: TonB family protein [Bacteroidetes bacterium]|nr:TonB family protein [Bacteroidota bacterium]
MNTPDSAHETIVQPRPLLITLGIHALLLLLLLLWHFNLPAQQPASVEMGMEVNLGTSDQGSGDDQPMDVEDPASSAMAAHRAAEASPSSADVERSDDENAASISAAATNSRGNASQPTTSQSRSHSQAPSNANARSTQAQRPRYVYPGSSGRGGNSAAANMPGSNEGNTTGPDDRGVPRGTPGADNYVGSPGNGTGGVSYSLSGRTMIAFPTKEARFRHGGRVVVRVTVARDGSITNRQIKSSTNSDLNAIALHKAQEARFNADSQAPDEQFGEIIFVFTTRQ